MEGKALMLLLSLCSAVLPDDFRLVDGPNRCAGKLDKCDEGRWTEVQDLELAWNRTSAAEVCRQLDCGSVVSMKRSDKEGDWMDFRMEITCSDTVRLVNGSGLCSGRLEVKSDQFNQSWISVDEDGFDQRDAEVVCRELDCGPPSVLQGELFGSTEASEMSKNLECRGTEATLSDCLSSVSNYSGKAAGLTCSEPKDIRLVGGSSRCAGTLQMKLRGEWKRVYKQTWTLEFAGEVCKQLGCGSPLSVTRKGGSLSIFWDLHDCDGPSLTDCVKGIVQSDQDTEINCSDSVRLVDGSNPCSGGLQVKSNESWSFVCEDGFNPQDAEVVCREIGCGPASVQKWTHNGETDAPIWRKEAPCGGHESSILNCGGSWLGKQSCPSGSSAVGLTCSEPEVRLVKETSHCSGVLELKQFGEWRAAGNGDGVRDWTLTQADAVCQRLDCGSCVLREIVLQSKASVSQIDFSCINNLDCMGTKYFENIFRVRILCSDFVKLVNRSNGCTGTLELKTNQSWSRVCAKDFDQQAAQVTCREIGCGPPEIHQGALFGAGEAPLRGRKFQCEGNESALLDCRRSGSSSNSCSPENTVGLVCSDYLRLVGENSHCAGTLEMLYQGQWRPVADLFDQADNQLSTSVCAELGCGTVVSAKTREEPSQRPVWWIESICLRSASELRQCVALNDAPHDTSLEVICSDVLADPDISLFLYPGKVHAARKQTLDIPIGSAFGIVCSIKPQYPAGSFELVSNTSTLAESLTQPAVEHSALFLFPAADHTHRRTYRCVYHVYAFSRNFSFLSRPISLTVSASPLDFIIRHSVVLTFMMLSITILYCYFKFCKGNKTRQKKGRHLEDCSTKGYLELETGGSGNK